MVECWLSLSEVAASTPQDLSARPVAWRRDQRLVRADFVAQVQAWASVFAPVAGPSIALSIDDGWDFACALFGAWAAGKVVWLPGDAQPGTLARLLPQVDACAGQLPGALAPPEGIADSGARPSAPLDLRRISLKVCTSGSSGEPLIIAKTLAQLDCEVRALQSAFGSKLGDECSDNPLAVHATVSHQHLYGLLFVILWPLAAGRAFVAERLVYPEDLARTLGRRPSVLVSSPAHLKRLPEALDWQDAGRGLRAVFSSGGPLPFDAAQASLALLGQLPIEVFGSSETGGIAWRQHACPAREVWHPLPGVEWRIESVQADGSGLLSVRSAHLLDAQAWQVTADRVRAAAGAGSEAGFLHLGRADRIVKIEEKRVSITALEERLNACDEVREARLVVLDASSRARLAVVAVPSESGAALLRQGKRLLNMRLRDCLLQGVERVALPRRFRYVRALPLDAQGKTSEARLAALFRPLMPALVWRHRGAAQATAELDISADLMAFDGHFPEGPILPGVVQLDWAVQLAQVCFGPVIARRFLRVDALKFQRPVLPGARIELSLRWRAADGVLAFAYTSGADTVHSSGNIVFAADNENEKDDA